MSNETTPPNTAKVQALDVDGQTVNIGDVIEIKDSEFRDEVDGDSFCALNGLVGTDLVQLDLLGRRRQGKLYPVILSEYSYVGCEGFFDSVKKADEFKTVFEQLSIQEDPERDFLKAAVAGDLKRVEQLLKAGVDINATPSDEDPDAGLTACYVAALTSNTEMAEFLVTNKADPNIKYRGVKTALSAAVQDKNGCVEILLRAGAAPDEIDEDGYTALHVAVNRGSIEHVDALLSAGANVDAKTTCLLSPGETPLMIAVRATAENAPVVQLLLDHGGNVNAQDSMGRTALQHLV